MWFFGVQKGLKPCSSSIEIFSSFMVFCYLLHYMTFQWGLILAWISLSFQTDWIWPSWLSRNSHFVEDFRSLQLQTLACLYHVQLWEEHNKFIPDVLITKEKDSKKMCEHTYFFSSCKYVSQGKPSRQLLWSHRL